MLPAEAKYCLKCRADRRRRAKLKYTWRAEYDAYLRAHYFSGLNRRFRVLSQMVQVTGLPRRTLSKAPASLVATPLPKLGERHARAATQHREAEPMATIDLCCW